MGIAALVIGIVALVFSVIPFVGTLAFFLVVPGGLLSIGQIAWPKKKKGMAVAGLILCILAGGIAYFQLQATKVVGEGLEELSQEMEENRKEFEAKTGMVLDKTPSDSAKAKSEPLKLNGMYAFSNEDGQIQVVDLENLTDKTITVFRGYIITYDDFGKVAKRSQITYKQTIAPKGKIVIAEAGDGLQSQVVTAGTIKELSKQLPLPYDLLKVGNTVKFECTDVKYAE